MGNSTSNAANNNLSHSHSPSRRTQSPSSVSSRGGSPAPSSNGSVSHRVHKSLRTKKKSLELPDLASLALTPASSGSPNSSPHAAFRRPRASSPIPIPISPHPPPAQVFGVQNNLPSAARLALANTRRGSRYRSYLSSTSVYPSMHSFRSNSRERESDQQNMSDQGSPPRTDISSGRGEFQQEVVHSTIPLALMKAEDVPRPEHVTVTIKWKGGGKQVILARAGDDYWKGRQPMEYDPDSKAFVTQIHVLPGTHHFKFIVDDQWRITDQYPTAVDDLDGSLSNYVNANSPTSTSPSSVSPQQTPHPNHANHFASFWSDSSSRDGSGSGDGKGEAAWTTIIPQELINAAGEEEHYLASAGGSPSTSSSVPAPNIPPAPVLPRHLDKLILNVRPQIVGAPGSPGETARTKKDKEREKEKSRRERREREGRSRGHTPSHLGMTSSTHDGGDDGSGSNAHLALPVVTASGTDVTAVYGSSSPSTPAEREEGGGAHLHAKKPSIHASATNKLVDVLALADDASVLPVPSHVVLHHLSTSAIKSGVLAVANTTRYKKKYITTIYYKPT